MTFLAFFCPGGGHLLFHLSFAPVGALNDGDFVCFHLPWWGPLTFSFAICPGGGPKRHLFRLFGFELLACISLLGLMFTSLPCASMVVVYGVVWNWCSRRSSAIGPCPLLEYGCGVWCCLELVLTSFQCVPLFDLSLFVSDPCE